MQAPSLLLSLLLAAAPVYAANRSAAPAHGWTRVGPSLGLDLSNPRHSAPFSALMAEAALRPQALPADERAAAEEVHRAIAAVAERGTDARASAALLALASESQQIGVTLLQRNPALFQRLSADVQRDIQRVQELWRKDDVDVLAGPASQEKRAYWRRHAALKPAAAPIQAEVARYSAAVTDRINGFLRAVGEPPLSRAQEDFLRATHFAVLTYNRVIEGYHHRDHQFGLGSVEYHALDATLRKLESEPNLKAALKTSLAEVIVAITAGLAAHDAELIKVEVKGDGTERWVTEDSRKRPDNELGAPLHDYEEGGRRYRLYGKPKWTQSNTRTSLAFLETAPEAKHLKGNPLVQWMIQSTAFGPVEQSGDLQAQKAAWEADIERRYGEGALRLAKAWFGDAADIWNLPLKGPQAWLVDTEGLRLEFENVTPEYRELAASLSPSKTYFVPGVIGTPGFWEFVVMKNPKNISYLRHVAPERLGLLLQTFLLSHHIEAAAPKGLSGAEGYRFAKGVADRLKGRRPHPSYLKRLRAAAAKSDEAFAAEFAAVYQAIKADAR